MGKQVAQEFAARAEGAAPAIDYRSVEALIPYARNARTHSEAQVALIAGSIREYGFTNPVLVDGENGIIAGHGRVMAARKLGLTRVPVIELAHLSEAQRRAYILADNKLAEQAGWDRDLLALEVGELADLRLEGSHSFKSPKDHAGSDVRDQAVFKGSFIRSLPSRAADQSLSMILFDRSGSSHSGIQASTVSGPGRRYSGSPASTSSITSAEKCATSQE